MEYGYKFSISKEFKDALITGILSYPIIYIPHFHYSYIDQALLEIFPKEKNKSILGLDRRSILEVDCKGEPIDFETKTPFQQPKDIIGDDIWTFDNLCKGLVEMSKCNLYKRLLDSSHFAPIKEGANADKYFAGVDKSDQFGDFKIFVVKNVASQLANDINSTKIQYYLQEYASKYERGEYDAETTLILVSPQSATMLPPELEKYIMVIDVPNPTESEIHEIVETSLPISKYFEDRKDELTNQMTRAMMGLQLYEIEQIIRSVGVRTGGKLTKKALGYALEEKKSIVRKSGIIEVIDTDVSFSEVGGLDTLRKDLENKRIVFKHLNEFQEKRFPLPKGVLILGMPGCGKSLIAKAIANEFGISLLRLDVNRLMGQYVGQSEENLRKALRTAEAAHPCVLWIDEIEKAFAGANGSSGNDLVMRLMGHFLTWMQERTSPIYIVATANDALRPELMRKGRFDEVYFVDFPNLSERKDILEKKIKRYKDGFSRGSRQIDYSEIMDLSAIDDEAIKEIAALMVGGEKNPDGFAGAEIECVVNGVIEDAFVKYYKDYDDLNKVEGTSTKPQPVKVKVSDFEEKIKIIQPSVMCNQTSMGSSPGAPSAQEGKEKTPVDRIRELQKIYHFKKATSDEKK